MSGPSQAMIESRVLLQSRHLKHFLCHSRLLANTCSAAKTTPPQRGHPFPGGALIDAVSTTVVRGAASLKYRKNVIVEIILHVDKYIENVEHQSLVDYSFFKIMYLMFRVW